VSWIASRALKAGFVFSVAIGIVALAVSGLRAILLEIYLLGIGSILLLALVRATQAAAVSDSSDFDRALAGMNRGPPTDSSELALTHDVEQSSASAFHLHLRLRPILREIAAYRLWRRFGVHLDLEPTRAQELVGAKTWELVRPGRPPPDDRLALGPPPSELREVADELERI
jgi:hypothetical protein